MILDQNALEPKKQPSRELIVHRNNEINTLSSIFEPVTDGHQISGAFIHGPPGSGKTCAAKVLLNELPDAVDGDDSTTGPPIETAYIDCYNGKSRREVYQELLETLGEGPAETRPATATDQLRRQTLDAIDGHLIVVLDEADQIGEKAVLKELYEMTGVALLPIVTKSHQLFADVEDRLDSRLTALTPIPFRAYDEDTLIEIMQVRANVGLERGVVDRDQLKMIAERSQNDARRAISILKNAVMLARSQGTGEVTTEILGEATPLSQVDVVRSHLSALSRSQRICLEVIGKVGPETSGPITESYCSDVRIDEERRQRTIRDWIQDFKDRELVTTVEVQNGPAYELREHVREVLDGERVPA